MERALDLVIDRIRRSARAVTGNQLRQVAATASFDCELASLILEALDKTGRDGVISIESHPAGKPSHVVVTEGTEFDRGFVSARFATDPGQSECLLDDVLVLWFDGRISSNSELIPLMEQAAKSGKALLVVAADVEGEALALMLLNHQKGTLRCCAVKAPGFGDRQNALLQDLAIVTGGTFIDVESGRRIANVQLAELGRVERAVIGKDRTALFNGAGSGGCHSGACHSASWGDRDRNQRR